MSEIERWEYDYQLHIDSEGGGTQQGVPYSLSVRMNHKGEDGWELCCVVPHPVYGFKTVHLFWKRRVKP
jgi:hypothetical protein